MNRETAIVEFFRARLREDEQIARAGDDACWHIDFCDDEGPTYHKRFDPERMLRDVEADHKLLERYDYCVSGGGCPGNEALDAAREEYENYVFPLRIARFSDHPAYAALVASRWVYEDYASAVGTVTT